jgi:hypothetical protein
MIITLGKAVQVGSFLKIEVFSEISNAGNIYKGKDASSPKLYINLATIVKLL